MLSSQRLAALLLPSLPIGKSGTPPPAPARATFRRLPLLEMRLPLVAIRVVRPPLYEALPEPPPPPSLSPAIPLTTFARPQLCVVLRPPAMLGDRDPSCVLPSRREGNTSTARLDILLEGDLPLGALPDIAPVKDASLPEEASPENEMRPAATEDAPPENETRLAADDGTRAAPPDEE